MANTFTPSHVSGPSVTTLKYTTLYPITSHFPPSDSPALPPYPAPGVLTLWTQKSAVAVSLDSAYRTQPAAFKFRSCCSRQLSLLKAELPTRHVCFTFLYPFTRRWALLAVVTNAAGDSVQGFLLAHCRSFEMSV
jgi:hypothetical protein